MYMCKGLRLADRVKMKTRHEKSFTPSLKPLLYGRNVVLLICLAILSKIYEHGKTKGLWKESRSQINAIKGSAGMKG